MFLFMILFKDARAVRFHVSSPVILAATVQTIDVR